MREKDFIASFFLRESVEGTKKNHQPKMVNFEHSLYTFSADRKLFNLTFQKC